LLIGLIDGALGLQLEYVLPPVIRVLVVIRPTRAANYFDVSE
jgi:hypothetical protein